MRDKLRRLSFSRSRSRSRGEQELAGEDHFRKTRAETYFDQEMEELQYLPEVDVQQMLSMDYDERQRYHLRKGLLRVKSRIPEVRSSLNEIRDKCDGSQSLDFRAWRSKILAMLEPEEDPIFYYDLDNHWHKINRSLGQMITYVNAKKRTVDEVVTEFNTSKVAAFLFEHMV